MGPNVRAPYLSSDVVCEGRMPCDKNASPAALVAQEGDHPAGSPMPAGDGVARTANTVSGTGVRCELPALIGISGGSEWTGVGVGCGSGAFGTGVNNSSSAANALWFIASMAAWTSCACTVERDRVALRVLA